MDCIIITPKCTPRMHFWVGKDTQLDIYSKNTSVSLCLVCALKLSWEFKKVWEKNYTKHMSKAYWGKFQESWNDQVLTDEIVVNECLILPFAFLFSSRHESCTGGFYILYPREKKSEGSIWRMHTWRDMIHRDWLEAGRLPRDSVETYIMQNEMSCGGRGEVM